MATRFIIKTASSEGIPSNWEMVDFEAKNGLGVGEVDKLYVAFKVGRRRKIKRLRITVNRYPCELCGEHVEVNGKVGGANGVEFSKETY